MVMLRSGEMGAEPRQARRRGSLPPVAHATLPPDAGGTARTDGPRFVYPDPLTAEDAAAMERALPDDVTEAHLRWLETGEGDPWGERSG
jgi:hypothetical protein